MGDAIPEDVTALVRDTFRHAGNAATDGRPWNINTAMRFAELCVVADRAARTPDAGVLREALKVVDDLREKWTGGIGRNALRVARDRIAALASPAPITKTAIAEHGETDAGVAEMAPAKGDYVLATKYRDGSPSDQWSVGFYDRFDGERHFVVNSHGSQFRGNGFRRAAKITSEQGAWLLKNIPPLEGGPLPEPNIWDLLAAAPSQEQPNGK